MGSSSAARGQESKRATIKDVQTCRHMQSTVSNALNDRSGKMAQETADRIRSAIDALGYVPHGAARQLKRGYAASSAFLCRRCQPVRGEFVRAVEEAAFPLDFGVFVGNSDRSRERERAYAESMYQQGIRTVIFASSPLSLEHLAALARRGLFIVIFDRRFHAKGDFPNVDCVTVNNVHGSTMATQHLLDLGHRRIGFSLVRYETRAGMTGTTDTARLAAAGIAPRRAWLWEGPRDGARDFGDAAAADLGTAGAVDLFASRAGHRHRGHQRHVRARRVCGGEIRGAEGGRDVSIVGFDDIVLAGLVAARLDDDTPAHTPDGQERSGPACRPPPSGY